MADSPHPEANSSLKHKVLFVRTANKGKDLQHTHTHKMQNYVFSVHLKLKESFYFLLLFQIKILHFILFQIF